MSDAMRDSFGKKLAEIGEKNKKLVVFDADVSGSSKSSYFAKAFPDRFFNVGVAEGNMAGVAAGMATAGYHPVINAFAIFLALKSLDQLRHDFCYNHLPVVIAGAYGGLSDSFDGASHQAIADIAIMRSLPNMELIVPGDSVQAGLALEYALNRDCPVYIRLNRNAFDDLSTNAGFADKKPILIRPRTKSGTGVTIAANGITIHAALKAAKLLEKDGIDADVFSTPFVKPLIPGNIAVSLKETGKLVTIEEHNILAGAGSAMLEQLAKDGTTFKYLSLGLNDCFGDTGPYDVLLEKYGLDAAGIADSVKKFAK
ncbi:MAG: transketolase family protein [Termitinemataceae bacterium]|nr:MAG: transketolase family protein [Termitinemataceae bacterium]